MGKRGKVTGFKKRRAPSALREAKRPREEPVVDDEEGDVDVGALQERLRAEREERVGGFVIGSRTVGSAQIVMGSEAQTVAGGDGAGARSTTASGLRPGLTATFRKQSAASDDGGGGDTLDLLGAQREAYIAAQLREKGMPVDVLQAEPGKSGGPAAAGDASSLLQAELYEIPEEWVAKSALSDESEISAMQASQQMMGGIAEYALDKAATVKNVEATLQAQAERPAEGDTGGKGDKGSGVPQTHKYFRLPHVPRTKDDDRAHDHDARARFMKNERARR